MISVIIPVYNAKDYLERCLDSVLGQSFNGRIEILLVDDGSTDGSGAICDEYARKRTFISVFHTENHGASLARRYGLERAEGEYVTFIDSDDYVSPDYISSLYYLEKRFGAGICGCKVQRTKSGEIVAKESIHNTPYILDGDVLLRRFFKYEFWGLPGKLYRKKYLMEIPFPKATICEDYFVMIQLLFKVGRMAYSENPLYYYEGHLESLSRLHLSLRSFEEFDNVYAVFDYTSVNLPKYRAYALSNAAETAVKLLLASRKTKISYAKQRRYLTSFLAQHRGELLFCKPLNPKTRLLALGCSI